MIHIALNKLVNVAIEAGVTNEQLKNFVFVEKDKIKSQGQLHELNERNSKLFNQIEVLKQIIIEKVYNDNQ